MAHYHQAGRKSRRHLIAAPVAFISLLSFLRIRTHNQNSPTALKKYIHIILSKYIIVDGQCLKHF